MSGYPATCVIDRYESDLPDDVTALPAGEPVEVRFPFSDLGV